MSLTTCLYFTALFEVLEHLPEATSDLQCPYMVLVSFALPKNLLFVALTQHLKYISDTAGGCTGVSCPH